MKPLHFMQRKAVLICEEENDRGKAINGSAHKQRKVAGSSGKKPK